MDGVFDLSAMKVPLKENAFIEIEPAIEPAKKIGLFGLSPLLNLLFVLEDPENRVAVPRGQYHRYMASNVWKNKSRAMREYFKTCAICNSTKNLCVHHKHYDTVGHEGLEDLVVLCGDHHWEYEEKRIKAKEENHVGKQ